jgi:hypothetical protein
MKRAMREGISFLCEDNGAVCCRSSRSRWLRQFAWDKPFDCPTPSQHKLLRLPAPKESFGPARNGHLRWAGARVRSGHVLRLVPKQWNVLIYVELRDSLLPSFSENHLTCFTPNIDFLQLQLVESLLERSSVSFSGHTGFGHFFCMSSFRRDNIATR